MSDNIDIELYIDEDNVLNASIGSFDLTVSEHLKDDYIYDDSFKSSIADRYILLILNEIQDFFTFVNNREDNITPEMFDLFNTSIRLKGLNKHNLNNLCYYNIELKYEVIIVSYCIRDYNENNPEEFDESDHEYKIYSNGSSSKIDYSSIDSDVFIWLESLTTCFNELE